MLISLFLSYLSRRRSFAWTPSLDLSDHEIYSALIPGTQY